MKKRELNIAIEKNRTALMRIVLCWLLFASIFKRTPKRILPRRIGLWVLSQISKAELATNYLYEAAALPRFGALSPEPDHAHLSVGDVIARLKALKKTLVELRYRLKRSTCKHNAPHTCQPKYLARLNNSFYNSYPLYAFNCAKTHIWSSRAPPLSNLTSSAFSN